MSAHDTFLEQPSSGAKYRYIGKTNNLKVFGRNKPKDR